MGKIIDVDSTMMLEYVITCEDRETAAILCLALAEEEDPNFPVQRHGNEVVMQVYAGEQFERVRKILNKFENKED